MRSAKFPEADIVFVPPEGWPPSMQRAVSGHKLSIRGGTMDGATFVVVAWKPSRKDLRRLKRGGLIYLTTYSCLPPNKLSTRFEDASRPIPVNSEL